MAVMDNNKYYYLNEDKRPLGPFSREELIAQQLEGKISADVLVAADGGAQWLPLAQVLTQEPEFTSTDTLSPWTCSFCNKQHPASAGQLVLSCPSCQKEFAPNPESSLWAHFLSSMRRYACFKGRATRKEFWSFYLFHLLITLPFTLVTQSYMMAKSHTDGAESLDLSWGALSADMPPLVFICYICLQIIELVFLLPNMGVAVRRFHDVGYRGIVPVIPLLLSQLSFMSGGTFISPKLVLMGGVLMIVVLVFAFLDSARGSNRFGPSSKYPS